MSVEEDTELRDLVSQTLENNGVLAKIRAELRASVFLALEEQESNTTKTPFENKALKEYLKTPQAGLGLCIVREFLEYLELDFTLSVYNTETSHGKGYEYSGRNKLAKDLQIKNLNGRKGPLLAHILQIAQESSGVASDMKEGAAHASSDNVKTSSVGSLLSVSLDGGMDVESPNVSGGPLDRTFTSDGSTFKGILSASSPGKSEEGKLRVPQSHHQSSSPEFQINSEQKVVSDPKNVSSQSRSSSNQRLNQGKASTTTDLSLVKDSSVDKQIKGNNQTSSIDRKQLAEAHYQTQDSKGNGKNSMSSLNDLPPLDGLKPKRTANHGSGVNFADLDLPDDYEEDFMSTDSSNAFEENSKSQSKKSSNKQGVSNLDKSSGRKLTKGNDDKAANSPVGSISEDIEEDTNSGVDDLLNSTSTDNTVDATLSLIQNNCADYMEKL